MDCHARPRQLKKGDVCVGLTHIRPLGNVRQAPNANAIMPTKLPRVSLLFIRLTFS